jgi:hypothetical protein
LPGPQGQEADRLLTRTDLGVVSPLAELRGHERRAAEELEQWMTVVEERKPLDASLTAITLAMLMTPADLEDLEPGAEGAGVCDVIDAQAPAPATGPAFSILHHGSSWEGRGPRIRPARIVNLCERRKGPGKVGPR